MKLSEFYDPFIKDVPILPLGRGLFPYKFVYENNILCDDSRFFFKYQFNTFNSNDKDFFNFGSDKFFLNMYKDIVDKYVIINGFLEIKPKSTISGYFWVCISEKEVLDPTLLRNSWNSVLLKISDGLHINFFNYEYKMMFFNQSALNEYWIYIFSDTNVFCEFDVNITKNINFIPLDLELFPTKVNYNLNISDLTDFNKKNNISNVAFKKNVIRTISPN